MEPTQAAETGSCLAGATLQALLGSGGGQLDCYPPTPPNRGDYGVVILSMLTQTQSHVTGNAHTSKPKHLHQCAKAQSGLICQNAGAQKPNGTQLQITNGERGSATAVTLLAMLHSLGTMGSLQSASNLWPVSGPHYSSIKHSSLSNPQQQALQILEYGNSRQRHSARMPQTICCAGF